MRYFCNFSVVEVKAGTSLAPVGTATVIGHPTITTFEKEKEKDE
jgi:hypothetical protein